MSSATPPSKVTCAPAEAAAKGDEEAPGSVLKAAVGEGVGQGQGYGAVGGVSDQPYVHDHSFAHQAESFGDRFDYTAVGLMRYQQIDLVAGPSQVSQQLVTDLAHSPYGMHEYGLSILLDKEVLTVGTLAVSRHGRTA